MANVVYVGNYPNTLSGEDILEIFKDFEGLTLLRSVKQNRKCYSFILCQDQEQVVDVVFAFNGVDVDGRNLVVRASDDELQEIIDQCEYEESYEYDYAPDGRKEQMHQGSSRSFENTSETQYSQMNYRQPRKPSHLASAKVTHDSFSKEGQNCIDSEKGVYSGAKGNETDFVLSRDTPNDASGFETASCYSYSTNRRSLSPCSVASSTYCKRKGEKFSFVSIVNFPDGTTTEELQEMFEDYNPLKIIMQNQTSYDDTPTEAVICFLKSKDATSSIISLDNTLYEGRVILVTECDDVSLISDLIKVHPC